MSGREEETRGNEPTVDHASPLQPVEPVAIAEFAAGLDPRQVEEALRQQEDLQRRLADQRLRDALAEQNFTGRRYRRFEEELAAYGMSVLRGWMYTGHIFQLTAGRGLNLKPTEYELEELTRDSDVREELANMTIAITLPRFREQALIGGGWQADRGAGLPTYFMGATLYVFPNQFRQHREYRNRYARITRVEGVLTEPAANPVTDPAVLAAGDDAVWQELRSLDARTAAVVTATLDGYSQEEIGEMFGITERAVEGIVYRWRIKARTRIGSAGGGEQR